MGAPHPGQIAADAVKARKAAVKEAKSRPHVTPLTSASSAEDDDTTPTGDDA